MIRPDETVAEIRHWLAASPERVFAAFASALQVSRWLSPAPEITLDVLAFDFREGGAFRYAYRVPDHGTMIVNGAYLAIEPPSRLVFTWNIEPPDEHAGLRSEVTVTISAERGGSELHIRHERLSLPGSCQRHAEGWRGALGRLSALLDRPVP